MVKYIVDKVFSEGPAFVFLAYMMMYGLYHIITQEAELKERQEQRIVTLVEGGTPLPEARCAIKGC